MTRASDAGSWPDSRKTLAFHVVTVPDDNKNVSRAAGRFGSGRLPIIVPIHQSTLHLCAMLGLCSGVLALIGFADAADDGVADDVGGCEADDADALQTLQPADRIGRPRGIDAAGQIDLPGVAAEHHAAVHAKALEEHLHLRRRNVLRLVQDDEAVRQRVSRMKVRTNVCVNRFTARSSNATIPFVFAVVLRSHSAEC